MNENKAISANEMTQKDEVLDKENKNEMTGAELYRKLLFGI